MPASCIPGDTITADVLVSKSSEETVVLDHIVVIAQAKPDYKPTVFYHVPAPGDAVPDFKLRNQDGRAIHLEPVPRQDAAADIHLHALSAAQLLPSWSRTTLP